MNFEVSIMPHVVLVGEIDLESLFNELEPIFIKEEGNILRTSKSYIENTKGSILIESMTIEDGVKKELFMIIGKRDDGIVIRLSPLMEVEKTTGVKRLLAETAKHILSKHPEYKIGKTNLNEWL